MLSLDDARHSGGSHRPDNGKVLSIDVRYVSLVLYCTCNALLHLLEWYLEIVTETKFHPCDSTFYFPPTIPTMISTSATYLESTFAQKLNWCMRWKFVDFTIPSENVYETFFVIFLLLHLSGVMNQGSLSSYRMFFSFVRSFVLVTMVYVFRV